MPQINLEAIKKAMKRKGITQPQLASRLRITPSSVYRKLSGETEFTASQLGEISDYLGITVVDIFGYHEKSQGGIF